MKFRPPEIFLGVFLTVAVFAMGMTFQSSRQPPSNQSTAENADQGSAVVAADKSPNITDWLLVIFNGLLFGSNLLLWRVTKTAADAAKKAAEAADLSAKAVTVVERAYVYPVIVSPGAIEQCIRAALDSEDDYVPAPVTAELTFKFKNFGKTPAILKEAFVAFGPPPHGALIGVAIPESVLASLDETRQIPSQMLVGITRNYARRILTYTGHIAFEGHVVFDDIWGNEHTTEFYFVWDKEIKQMTMSGVRAKAKQEEK